MIYLYIKQCQHCGLKYYGRTTQDPNKYKGSGKYWTRHLKAHDIDHPETLSITECQTVEEAMKIGLKFSEDNNIVESDEWANQIPENGQHNNTYGINLPQSVKDKIGLANKGRVQTDVHRKKNSDSHKGELNHFYGKKHTDETKKKISLANKGRIESEEKRRKHSEFLKGKTYIEIMGEEKAKEYIEKKKIYNQKRSLEMRGKPVDSKMLEAAIKANSGKKWITDGSVNIRVDPTHILEDGWRFGKTHKKK